MEISQLEARIFLQIMVLNSTMEYNHGNRVNWVTQSSHLSWSRLDSSASCIHVVTLIFYYYCIIFCKRFVNLRLLTGSQFTVRSLCNKTVTNILNCIPFNKQKHILLNIVRVIKSRRMRWAGHVACMEERRGVHKVLVGTPEGKRPLGRPRRR